MKKSKTPKSFLFKKNDKEINNQTIKKQSFIKDKRKFSPSASQLFYRPKCCRLHPVTPISQEIKTLSRNLSFYQTRCEMMHQKSGFYIPNLIPNNLTDRLQFFYSIFNDEGFVEYYMNTPSVDKSSLQDITKYLSKYQGKRGILDTYAMFFYYICHKLTFDYDFDPYKKFNKTGLNFRSKMLNSEVLVEDKNQENVNENGSIDEEIEIDEERQRRNATNILKSGIGTQEDFCKLFEYMCKSSHLRIRRIIGKCKVYPKKMRDDDLQFNHCWDVIEIRNKWYFVDVTLGSSNYNPLKLNIGDPFNPYYFLTPSEYLINSHYPKEEEWQLTAKTISLQQYNKKNNYQLGRFYHQVYHKQIELLTHNFPYIKLNSPDTIIELKVKDSILRANIFPLKGKTKISEVKYHYNKKKEIFTFKPSFPGNGDYIMKIMVRDIASTDLIYFPLLNYKIQFNTESEIKSVKYLTRQKSNTKIPTKTPKNHSNNVSVELNLPKVISDYESLFNNRKKKKICLDNSNAYLYEPKNVLIKIGSEVKFRVKIKNVISVVVLDGRKWNYMKKKEDDIWEGTYLIQTENVSICSLKSCNVYTEVFEFKTIKV